jgi:hypothetical protein
LATRRARSSLAVKPEIAHQISPLHRRRYGHIMSAIFPKSDITERDYDVRFVPKADMLATSAISLLGLSAR